MPHTVVLILGGSIINPEEIDVTFLKDFKKIIIDYANQGNKILIVAGGGHTARKYQNAASSVAKISEVDLDWVGIRATKINAELIRSIFGKDAYECIIDNPTEKILTQKKIIIGSGWQPGCSSDKDAVLLAENFKADTLVNITNVDYVYDKDPSKFTDAKHIKKLSWEEMKGIVGAKWKPGMNLPFDPVASRKAASLKLRLIIMSKDLNNFKNFLLGKKFIGTVIS